MGVLSARQTRATVPLSNLPERTKQVDNTVVGATCPLGGGTVSYLSAFCQRDVNGQYWLSLVGRVDFNTITLTDSTFLTLPGIAFNALRGSFSFATEAVRTGRGVTNTDQLWATTDGGCSVLWWDLYLPITGKPSWFDANREAGFSITAQVENASASSSGLLPSYEKVTIDMAGDNQVASGTAIFIKMDNLVVASFKNVTRAGGAGGDFTTATPMAGLPASFRPSSGEFDVFGRAGAIFYGVQISSSGRVNFLTRTSSDVSAQASGTGPGANVNLSLSYLVD